MAAVQGSRTSSFHKRRSVDSIKPISKESTVSGKQKKVTRKSSATSNTVQIVSQDALIDDDDISSTLEDLSINSNPFKVPADQDIFMLRDKERNKKKKNREREARLPVWEKQTYASRINKGIAATRKSALQVQEDEEN